MRTTLTLMVCLLSTGCVSDWNGDRFDSQYASRPHWPDCDGDGWGDASQVALDRIVMDDIGDELPVCVNAEEEDPPRCDEAGTTGDWQPNGFDCDDTYALSGSRVGPACPDEFGAFLQTPVTSGDYAVVSTAGREFLVWRDLAIGSEVARVMCSEWSGTPDDPDVVEGVFPDWAGERDDQVGDVVLPDLGMPENGQQLTPLVDHVVDTWGEASWLGWIDVSFGEGVGWAYTGVVESAVALEFCPSEQGLDLDGNGTVHPSEIYQGLIDGAESDEFIEEVHSEMRLVLRIQEGALPCLIAPTSTCAGEGLCTPAANLLCERPLQVTQQRELFELGDLECLQVGLDES